MEPDRFMVRCAVHLFLVKDGKILVEKRKNREYENNQLDVIASHILGNENAVDAIIIVSNDKLKGFAAGVKEAGVNGLKKGKKVASYVTGKVKSAASSLADTIKSKINPQKIQ